MPADEHSRSAPDTLQQNLTAVYDSHARIVHLPAGPGWQYPLCKAAEKWPNGFDTRALNPLTGRHFAHYEPTATPANCPKCLQLSRHPEEHSMAQPDTRHSALERATMDLARQLETKGLTDDAKTIRSSVAQLRDLLDGTHDNPASTHVDVHDALSGIAEAANTARQIIARHMIINS